MKKLLMLTALAMVASAPVMAERGPNGDRDGRGPGDGGKRMGEMMFKQHDTNNDGVITKEEFMKTVEARFDKMDADSDGKVTKEEVKKHGDEMKKKFEEMREKREESKSSSEVESPSEVE
jgi:hypothetical protein